MTIMEKLLPTNVTKLLYEIQRNRVRPCLTSKASAVVLL